MAASRTPGVLLGLLGLGIVASRYHTLGEPYDRDISTYAVIARAVLGGRSLYADMWDHKPPAIYAAYGLAELVAGNGDGAVFLLGAIAALATLVGAWWAGRALGGPLAGGFAAAAWAIVSGDMLLEANQPNTEVFLNAALIWAFALLAARRPEGRGARVRGAFGAGLIVNLATLFKPIAVVVAGIARGARPDARRSAAGLAAGLLGWLVLSCPPATASTSWSPGAGAWKPA